MLEIGSVSVKGIGQNLPNFQLKWPAPPTQPVIMVVLLCTEPFAERLFEHTVYRFYVYTVDFQFICSFLQALSGAVSYYTFK